METWRAGLDARGITTNYNYDALNRLTHKSYQNDPASTAPASYGYDGVAGAWNCPPTQTAANPLGRRTSMCDAAGTESWSYAITPGIGWETTDKRTTNGVTFLLSNQNNFDGSLAAITYPDPITLNYAYNGAGRQVSTGAPALGVNFVSNATYTAFGALSSALYGTGININNTYNSRMQPLCLSAAAPALTQSSIMSLCYDFHLGNQDNGNVYQLANGKNSNRTQNFTYDALNRIATAYTTGTNWGEIYSIDPWGNMTARNGIPGKNTYEPLSVGQATVKNQLLGFSYDAAGNMTQNGGATYVYDAENRLKSAGGVTYTYDGDGNRIVKSSGTIYWGGGEGSALVESDLSGNIQQEYFFFNGQRVLRADHTIGDCRFYFSNHLNSTSVITDFNGNIKSESDYYPYGGEIVITNNDSNHYKFNGKERDSESGLDDFPARYFTSSMGRWMTPDIMGGHADDPQTLNKYAYARNNPVSLTDPTGLDSYLSCTHTDQNGSTCQQQTVGYDKDGNAQKAWVQGQTGDNGKFTATLIGNDANGNLVDKTTGTGTYTASVNGSGVEFSNNGGQTSSSGVFVNGTPQTTFQDAGWANGNALSGFTFTLTNSKLEAGQTEAGTFFGIGNKNQVERAIEAAGFKYHFLGFDRHFDEYRSPGDPRTGANSGHFNVSELHQNPKVGVPITPGNMHFGEHNPFAGFGAFGEHVKEQQ